MSRKSVLPTVSTVQPSYAEFSDFLPFIEGIEQFQKTGMVKVKVPGEHLTSFPILKDETCVPLWRLKKGEAEMSPLVYTKIKGPLEQSFSNLDEDTEDIFEIKYNRDKNAVILLSDFSKSFSPDWTQFDLSNLSRMDLERISSMFFKNLNGSTSVYGADVPATLCNPENKVWNMNKLPGLLEYLKTDYSQSFPGVTSSYMYFGSWKAVFPMHTEDMDLYSVNYLHCGSPKIWYSIPPSAALKFEKIMAENYIPHEYEQCPAPFRHKTFFINPKLLTENNIPYNVVAQYPGEMVVVWPLTYHWGFNMGYNIAEAVNFATKRWIPYGKRVVRCTCSNERVNFSPAAFIKRSEGLEAFRNWIHGEDFGHHPEEENLRTRKTPSPRPNWKELSFYSDNSKEFQDVLVELGDEHDMELLTKTQTLLKKIKTSKTLEEAKDLIKDSGKLKGDIAHRFGLDESDDSDSEIDHFDDSMTENDQENLVSSNAQASASQQDIAFPSRSGYESRGILTVSVDADPPGNELQDISAVSVDDLGEESHNSPVSGELREESSVSMYYSPHSGKPAPKRQRRFKIH